MCQCPRALKVLVTATAVGLLTGFLGVGGGFLVVPALTLALGIGVTSLMLGVVDAVLLRPLPYADPGRLMLVFNTSASASEPD